MQFTREYDLTKPVEISAPADADAYGLADKQIVKVRVESGRTTIFDDVVVRVNPTFALAMHIDTDECNAAAAFGTVYGTIVD